MFLGVKIQADDVKLLSDATYTDKLDCPGCSAINTQAP